MDDDGRHGGELVPGFAGSVDDVAVGFEDGFDSQLARRYCQTFSTGFSSGERDGSMISVMFFGISSLSVVCQPARSRRRTACAPRATVHRSHRYGAASWVSAKGRRAPRRHRGLGRWRRTSRRYRSAGRPAGAGECHAWPTAGRSRSSVRSGLRPGTRSRYVFPWGCGRDAPSGSPGSFFECLDNPGLLARMARSRADVGEADLLQELADRSA